MAPLWYSERAKELATLICLPKEGRIVLATQNRLPILLADAAPYSLLKLAHTQGFVFCSTSKCDDRLRNTYLEVQISQYLDLARHLLYFPYR